MWSTVSKAADRSKGVHEAHASTPLDLQFAILYADEIDCTVMSLDVSQTKYQNGQTFDNMASVFGRIPMLIANEHKRRLKTAHWAGTFGAIIFLNEEFEITVVLDDRIVELRIRVSVSMPSKNFAV